jgi:hypothetical protein
VLDGDAGAANMRLAEARGQRESWLDARRLAQG